MQVHKVLPNQSFDAVFDELLSKIEYINGEILNKDYFLTLKQALEKVELNPAVDVYWVRDEHHSSRIILQSFFRHCRHFLISNIKYPRKNFRGFFLNFM